MKKQTMANHMVVSVKLSRLLVGVFMVLSLATAMPAQSGRKPPKKDDAPAPVQPPANAEPVTLPPTAKPEVAKIPIRLMSYWLGADSGYYQNVVVDSCIKRLNEAGDVTASESRADASRQEAIDYAKNSKEIYALWIELVLDHQAIRYESSANRNDTRINFYLYEPVTGKQKTWGSVHLRPYQPGADAGGVGLPLPTSSRVPIQYLLQQAGHDLADRVLSALNHQPGKRPF